MASIKQFSDPLTRKKSQPVPTVQRKLKVGNPNDKSEQEANNVADRVMRMPENEDQETLNMQPQEEEEKVSKISRQAEEEDSSTIKMQPEEEEKSAVSMKPEEEEASLQKQEDEEKVNLQSEEEETSISKAPEDKEEVNLKSTATSTKENYAPSKVVSQINASQSGGKALPEKANEELSQKMGRDFSDVKIHKDSRAVQMNKDLNAKAFTHKNHIYFNKGQYNPESSGGKHLLAHELTHVIQQKGTVQPKVQRQNGGNNTVPFSGKLKKSLSIKFYSTKNKPNIKIILYHRPIECWRSTILSFDTIIDQASRTQKTINTSGDENKELKTILKYTMNNAIKHSFNISIDSPCPGPTQGYQLAVRGKIIRY